MKAVAWMALSLACAMQGAAAQEFKFNLGTVLDPKHPVSIGMVKMAEAAEKQSGGKLKLEIFPSSQLGAQREMWQNVQAGLIGGIVDPTASLANFVPQFAVLDLPYLVETPDQAFKEMKRYKFGWDFLHPEFKRFVYAYADVLSR